MITFFQEREIEKYLQEKKISGKLLTEIKDHVISQILEIQNSKVLSFEEAFEETKVNWSKDLMMVKKNIFSRQKITKIAFEVDKITNRNLLLRSILFALLFVCFEITLSFFSNENLYLNIHKVFKIILAVLPFAVIGMYIQQKVLANKDYKDNVAVNNFIHPLFVFFITIVLDNLVDLPKNSFKVIYDYINFGSQGEVTTYVFAKSIISGIFLLALYLFSYFSLKENIRKFKNYKKVYN
jgi:hypothetical protein